MRPGKTLRLVYTIDTTETAGPVTVGLGAGLYDDQADDHSTGYGDLHPFPLKPGRLAKVSRPVRIPDDLPPGSYEVVAEVWPGEPGAEGTETLAAATCGHFDVP